MTANQTCQRKAPVNTTCCTVQNCQSSPATSQPIPLCTRHGVEVALAVLPLALAGTLAEVAGETGEDLADLQGRVGRRWRQGQINAVLSWIRKAEDPTAVSLEHVMDRLHLKQTTAYDRLKTAQQLFAAAQNPKSEKTA
ncbi:hypothetical protein [Streptomyces sp. DHE17-7]|uniref:hypothetical protein n=1 Tax=Streptomyces sp. DHE17-7 TaxID=2759949 RepID=UPI0022EA54F5|nr:hypothetical protein [Streptomyces sp. DHE17-7]MBJ6623504.1 hypothetical protein [Streptomyces sp. DHE17-7]